jgi:predicted XRE-type DNA-binding protein
MSSINASAAGQFSIGAANAMKTKVTHKRPRRPTTRASRGRRVGQTVSRGPARSGHVTSADGNVFADLGFPPGEAANLRLRSDLMTALERIISEMTQVEAAAVLGVSQPRISALKSGQIDRFTIDALVNMLARAGRDTRLSIKKS